MPAVHLRNLSFSYSSAVSILVDLSVSLGAGFTGVVGSNGSGKTTILKLIEGTLVPDRGSVDLDPVRALVAHCPQTADARNAAIERLAVADDGAARVLHGRLALDPAQLDRWATLSPGERKRWQVGAALYQQPDILLLDEPTNHLDEGVRDLLLAALARYRGVGVIVSHDRLVLNTLCRRVLRIDRGGAVLWQGDYDTARNAWEAAAQSEVEDYRRVKTEKKKVERRLADKRRASASKAARHRRELRTAGIKDKDARSMEKKGRFEGGQTQGSHDMALLRDQAERLDAAASEFDMQRGLGGELFFDYEPARKRRLLAFSGDLAVAGEPLLRNVDVVVERDDRILLAGPNGAGKSTLLRALLDGSVLPPERILYLPQELTADETHDLVLKIRSLDGGTKGRILGIVGLLGSDPKRILATDLPSPGEARKLLIASGLGRGAWILLLDEPTNHLDLPSIERLEAALAAFPGAVIVVTHDRTFAGETTRSRWTLANGSLHVG